MRIEVKKIVNWPLRQVTRLGRAFTSGPGNVGPAVTVTLSRKARPILTPVKYFALALPVVSVVGVAAYFSAVVLATGLSLPLAIFIVPGVLANISLANMMIKAFKAQQNNVQPRITKRDILLTTAHSGTALICSSAYILFRTVTTIKYAGIVLSGAGIIAPYWGLAIGVTLAALLLLRLPKGMKALPAIDKNNRIYSSGLFNYIRRVLTGAAVVGSALALLGAPGINLFLATLFLLAEYHAFSHAFGFNVGQIVNLMMKWKYVTNEEVKKYEEIPSQLTKPTSRGREMLIDVFTTVLIRQGINYQHIFCLSQLKKVDEAEQAAAEMAAVFANFRQIIGQAVNLDEISEEGASLSAAYIALGKACQQIGQAYADETTGLWQGNFIDPNDRLFSKEDAKQHHRFYGQLIKENGETLIRQGKELIRRGQLGEHLSLGEFKEAYRKLMQRYALFADGNFIVFCRDKYRNLNPRINSKIEGLSRVYSKRGQTLIEVQRQDRKTGEKYWELIPSQWDKEKPESYSADIDYVEAETQAVHYKFGVVPEQGDAIIGFGRTISFKRPFATVNTDGGVVDIDLHELVIQLYKDAQQAQILCRYAIPVNFTVPWRPELRENDSDELVHLETIRSPYHLYYEKDGSKYCVPWKPATDKAVVNPKIVDGQPCYAKKARAVMADNGACYIEIIYGDGSVERIAPRNAKTYSYQLELAGIMPRRPGEVIELEIDTGAEPTGYVKVGTLRCLEYVFQREDNTTYTRFIPIPTEVTHFDPQKVDYAKLNEQLKGGARKLKATSQTYTAHRFSLEKHKYLIDPGSKERPLVEFVGAQNREKFLAENVAFPDTPFVLGVEHNGQVSWQACDQVSDYQTVIDCRRSGQHEIEIIRKKEELTVDLEEIKAQIPQQYLGWLARTSIDEANGQSTMQLDFVNPHRPEDNWRQTIILSNRLAGQLPSPREIYDGDRVELQPAVFSLNLTKDGITKFYLKLVRVKREKRIVETNLAEGVKVSVVRADAFIKVRSLVDKSEQWLPFDQEIYADKVFFDSRSRWDSGLVWGKLDDICSAKNFIPSSKDNIPGVWGRAEQLCFFGQCQWIKHAFTEPGILNQLTSILGIGGIGGGIEQFRGLDGEEATLLPGTSHAKVVDGNLIWWEREAELPWPMEGDLEFKTQTEDAQRSLEAFWFDGGKTDYDQIYHSAEEDVGEEVHKLGTQRRRWMAPLGYGSLRWYRMLYHELINARLLRRYPARFTLHQLYNWNNVFNWYYDPAAKYLLMLMPLAYQLVGFAPLFMMGGLTFPLLWLGSYVSGITAYLFSMHKAGISPAYTFTKLQGLYFMLMPYMTEGLFFVKDEVTGPFKNTKGQSGGIPNKYLYTTLGLTFGVNMLALGLGLGAGRCNQAEDAKGIIFNTVWPAWNLGLAGLGFGLYLKNRLVEKKKKLIEAQVKNIIKGIREMTIDKEQLKKCSPLAMARAINIFNKEELIKYIKIFFHGEMSIISDQWLDEQLAIEKNKSIILKNIIGLLSADVSRSTRLKMLAIIRQIE